MIKSKKSQMEIMGLAVIVILVSLGILFAVQYVIFKKPTQTVKTYSTLQIASNTLNSLLTTTTDCRAAGNVDMTQLLQDCAAFPAITCDNGMNSCEFSDTSINYILNNTLKKWRYPFRLYVFTLSGSGNSAVKNQVFLRNNGDFPECISSNIGRSGSAYGSKDSKQFFIPTDVGTMYVQLDICGK